MGRNIIRGVSLIGLGLLAVILSLLNNRHSAAAPAVLPATTVEAIVTMREQSLPPPVPTLTPTTEPVVLRLEALEPVPGDEGTEVVSPLAGWPVRGEITQPFGCSPYYTGLPGPDCPAEAPWFHDGVDIGTLPGTPVRAALTGTVIFAGPDGSGPDCGQGYRGYGLAVVVATPTGWLAFYAHLARVDVTAGQTVGPETIIGTVGQTGCVSGPHLHFGLQQANDLVDPQEVRP